MRFLFSFLIVLLGMQNLSAQVLLEKVAPDPGHYIVTFKNAYADVRLARKKVADRHQMMADMRQMMSINIEKLKADLTDTNLEVKSQLWLRQAAAIYIAPKYESQLKALPYILDVSPDRKYQVKPQSVQITPTENVGDDIARLDLDLLWNEGYRGQGVTVAVLDTGVYLHNVLKNRWRGGTNSWFDPFNEYDTPRDTLKGVETHGTGVASLIAGGRLTFADGSDCPNCDYLGIAPEATWIAARILNNDLTTESILLEGFQWILDPDGDPSTDDYPDIVQNSWGLVTEEGTCNSTFKDYIQAIDDLGIDVVFSIGNTNSNPSSYLPPSHDQNVITVGSIDSNNVVVSSSGRGPASTCFVDERILPDLVAPGVAVKVASANSTSSEMLSGTSFASPMVSGVLALLRSKYHAEDHKNYRKAMFENAISLGLGNPNNDYGYGLVQASAAAAWLESESQTNSTITLRPSVFDFSSAKYSFAENTTSSVDIKVLRSGDISGTASVRVVSINGTAKEGSDYNAVDTTLDFLAMESQKTITVSLINDSETENTEEFSLAFVGTVTDFGDNSRVYISITDDDTAAEEDVIGGSAFGLLEIFFLLTVAAGRLVMRWV